MPVFPDMALAQIFFLGFGRFLSKSIPNSPAVLTPETGRSLGPLNTAQTFFTPVHYKASTADRMADMILH